ncbi:MAG TPA: NTP transferase domain-containing protein, partial [Solirubrobacteraceae bacterium]|nr:NTP transferase domain-containing protein [Solirubrobacteraceae bacterium]
MNAPTVVIMAAGKGTRMRSQTPKMLHDLCGRTLIGWVVAAAQGANAGKVIVVVGPDQVVEAALPDGVTV